MWTSATTPSTIQARIAVIGEVIYTPPVIFV
jgi:hypothetical protein